MHRVHRQTCKQNIQTHKSIINLKIIYTELVEVKKKPFQLWHQALGWGAGLKKGT